MNLDLYFNLVKKSYTDHENLISAGEVQCLYCPITENLTLKNVIVFRGTDSFADVLDDLHFKLQSFYGFGKVHSGFLSQFNTILPKLLNIINQGSLVFVGHSLGGALATLFATKYGGTCITFGSPKVGDETFVQYFNQNVIHSVRVVNARDIIPRSLPLYFSHVKGELKIGVPNWICCYCTGIRDHSLKKYEESLLMYNSRG